MDDILTSQCSASALFPTARLDGPWAPAPQASVAQWADRVMGASMLPTPADRSHADAWIVFAATVRHALGSATPGDAQRVGQVVAAAGRFDRPDLLVSGLPGPQVCAVARALWAHLPDAAATPVYDLSSLLWVCNLMTFWTVIPAAFLPVAALAPTEDMMLSAVTVSGLTGPDIEVAAADGLLLGDAAIRKRYPSPT